MKVIQPSNFAMPVMSVIPVISSKLSIPKFPALLASLVCAFALSGCAITAGITPQYVSPSSYQDYDCQQLHTELQRVNAYINRTSEQHSTWTATGVGVGIHTRYGGISPNITVGVGNSQSTQARDARLSQLYGERDALIQSGRLKNCAVSTGLKTYGE